MDAYNLAIFNRMFLDVRIIEQHKHGIVVCIPKNDISTTPTKYRQITLLNTDYKIPARIRTNRLKPNFAFYIVVNTLDCQVLLFSTR